MNLRAKHLLAFSVVLAALILFVPAVYGVVFTFVKALFEGSSFGKTAGFMAWLIALFLVLFLKDRGKLAGIFPEKINTFRFFLYFVVAIFAINFALNSVLFLMYANEINDFSGALATIVESGGGVEWSATYLGHMHAAKIALTPILGHLLDLKVDSGLPIYSITPFAEVFALVLIILSLGAIYFAFAEGYRNYRGKITIQTLLWAAAAYGFLVIMLDGGFFTVAAQINFGLIIFYYLQYHSNASQKIWQQFFYPILFLGGIQFILAYIFGIAIGATYGVTILAIILIFLIFAKHWRDIKFRPLWVLLLVVLMLVSSDAFVLLGMGKILWSEEENSLLVYGLPEGLTEDDIENAISSSFNISEIEIHNWVAIVKGNSKQLTWVNAIQEELRDAIPSESYMYVEDIDEGMNSIKITSPNDLTPLESCSSEFISFSISEKAGVQTAYASTPLNRLQTNLFALNCLFFQNKAEQPIVITN